MQGLMVKLKASPVLLNWHVIRLQNVVLSGKQSGVLYGDVEAFPMKTVMY